MGFLISVYYPSDEERQEMNSLIREERKVFKRLGLKTPVARGLSHGGLLLILGRLWRSHPELKALVQGACGGTVPSEGTEKPVLPTKPERLKKRPLNAKSARRKA